MRLDLFIAPKLALNVVIRVYNLAIVSSGPYLKFRITLKASWLRVFKELIIFVKKALNFS